MNILQAITQEQLRKDIPSFRPGDTLKMHVKVIEGTRERIQLFEGVVIKRRGGGISETLVKCVVLSFITFVNYVVKQRELKKFVARIVTEERGLSSSPFRFIFF